MFNVGFYGDLDPRQRQIFIPAFIKEQQRLASLFVADLKMSQSLFR